MAEISCNSENIEAFTGGKPIVCAVADCAFRAFTAQEGETRAALLMNDEELIESTLMPTTPGSTVRDGLCKKFSEWFLRHEQGQ